MKYKALISFSGTVSAVKGDTVEIADKEVAKDLLDANYIEEIKKPAPKTATKKK
jgi:hypothetical protein|nr:MAG TPA: hypothetical protein [Caudoviricetes sp.]